MGMYWFRQRGLSAAITAITRCCFSSYPAAKLSAKTDSFLTRAQRSLRSIAKSKPVFDYAYAA